MGLLDLDHASDDNPIKKIKELDERLAQLERTTPSGFFASGDSDTLMDAPGHVRLSYGDVYPDGETSMSMFRRMANVYNAAEYTDHFRTGDQPTGFAWAGGAFTTPSAIYNYNETYLQVTPTSGGQHFYFDSITTYDNCHFVARWTHHAAAACGIRLDNGTDNYYSEIYSWATGSGQKKISTRHRAGGAATETDIITGLRGDVPLVIQLYLYAPSTRTPYYYLHNESSVITLASTPNIAWTPSRVGFIIQEGQVGTGACYYDWFFNGFS